MLGQFDKAAQNPRAAIGHAHEERVPFAGIIWSVVRDIVQSSKIVAPHDDALAGS